MKENAAELSLGTAQAVYHCTHGLAVFYSQELITLHLEQVGHETQPPLLQLWYFFHREGKPDSC